ncbi:MAG: hypothetical protein HY000_04680 [Planctomycetes bacterium]|nr:hypothetical protein [Planctomycetota bacterium]
MDRFISTFGAPDQVNQNDSGAGATWKEPTSQRTASLGILAGGLVLIVYDDTTEAEVNKRRAKRADLGF